EFLSLDQLPPPLPTGEEYPEAYTPLPTNPPVSKESTLSSGSAGHQQARPNFHPSQYLPPHQLPLGEASHGDLSTPMSGVTPGNGDTDDSVSLNMRLSVGASSTSDMSAPGGLDDSEHGSDFDSMDELRRGVTIITDSQQQTEKWHCTNHGVLSPCTNYCGPSTNHGGPGRNHSVPSPNSNYCGPSTNHGSPGRNHSVPSPNSNYCGPSTNHGVLSPCSNYCGPSTNHGVLSPNSNCCGPCSNHGGPGRNHSVPSPN
ncbi:hypothetical protein KUCAC02_005911, partial [Chaenocephalus aceratus]